MNIKKISPSMDEWLKEAKADPNAANIGMYLVHNGTVRLTPKAKVRFNAKDTDNVTGMYLSYDKDKLADAITETYQMQGIYYVRVWLNSGRLNVGDDIMYVLVGGDIRPNVVVGLQALVEKIKSKCVTEKELYN